ncbi:unnamed protein product [Haemonchus placei]|uniref:Uncharacterized protein n=1 Tax=Haemonchus placei TaxID=6290 RepID=A0A0N4X7N5_HAEPC|nr:unnamed protein product [Haemonchus placei]
MLNRLALHLYEGWCLLRPLSLAIQRMWMYRENSMP